MKRVASQRMTQSHEFHSDDDATCQFSACRHAAMTDDPRSPKRPRLSPAPQAIIIAAPGDPSGSEGGSATGAEEKYTRDPDFWLEDGNLIILAGRSAFRVYRGLLAKFSPVFADMFTTGSAGATETFDNCPVVRLADHPEDLRDFLQYLMPCSALV